MPKTKKDLLHAIARRIGGERGKRLRAALKKKMPFMNLLESPISNKQFASELEKMENALLQAFARIEQSAQEKDGFLGI